MPEDSELGLDKLQPMSNSEFGVAAEKTASMLMLT